MLQRYMMVFALVLAASACSSTTGPSSDITLCEESTSTFPNFGCFDIKGEVRDLNNALLPGAYVLIGGSDCCTAALPLTDAQGAFHLRGFIVKPMYPVNADIQLKIYSEFPALCPPCSGAAAEDSTTVIVRAVAPGQTAPIYTASIRYKQAIPGL